MYFLISDFFEHAIVGEFTLYVFLPLRGWIQVCLLEILFMLLHSLETQAANTIKEVEAVIAMVFVLVLLLLLQWQECTFSKYW